jgi:RNA polymerase sigma-70 factor (ECF subfamily)
LAPNYADVASELGLTETAIKVGIHRLRQKYKKTLRRVVLETLDDPSELDDEIDALMMALG